MNGFPSKKRFAIALSVGVALFIFTTSMFASSQPTTDERTIIETRGYYYEGQGIIPSPLYNEIKEYVAGSNIYQKLEVIQITNGDVEIRYKLWTLYPFPLLTEKEASRPAVKTKTFMGVAEGLVFVFIVVTIISILFLPFNERGKAKNK